MKHKSLQEIHIGDPAFDQLGQENAVRVEQILDIATAEYGGRHPRLLELIKDLIGLYEGKWPRYQACQVGYHNLDHALEVTLATCRMASGWNRAGEKPPVTEDCFLLGVAASLFHDAGYIKERGDREGRGGKFTFSHVRRSMAMAADYLAEKGWSHHDVEAAAAIISCTEFPQLPDFESLFRQKNIEIMARVVASADILSQMSDVNYLENIKALYDEFAEGYAIETPEKLAERGVKIFRSPQELVTGTKDFYEFVVRPRLDALGRMGRFLTSFFGEGRNPYLENILANIHMPLENEGSRWRRLGEILGDLGVVTEDQIRDALGRQKKMTDERKEDVSPFRKRVLAWIEKKRPGHCLGEILLENKEIDPSTLCEALLLQSLPPAFIDRLNRGELVRLLRIMVLLFSIRKGEWVFRHVMELLNDLIDCEGSSVLLADPDAMEMLVVFPTGPKKDCLQGHVIPLDKGLAGWVYRHRKPVMVTEAAEDDRFYGNVDEQTEFVTRSVLAVPLLAESECVGVLEAVNSKAGGFNDHHMAMMTLLASFIAASLLAAIHLEGRETTD